MTATTKEAPAEVQLGTGAISAQHNKEKNEMLETIVPVTPDITAAITTPEAARAMAAELHEYANKLEVSLFAKGGRRVEVLQNRGIAPLEMGAYYLIGIQNCDWYDAPRKFITRVGGDVKVTDKWTDAEFTHHYIGEYEIVSIRREGRDTFGVFAEVNAHAQMAA